MNRPGYACLTCPKDECDGCTQILPRREEAAMLRCGIPKKRIYKKIFRTAATIRNTKVKNTLRAYCSTEWEI